MGDETERELVAEPSGCSHDGALTSGATRATTGWSVTSTTAGCHRAFDPLTIRVILQTSKSDRESTANRGKSQNGLKREARSVRALQPTLRADVVLLSGAKCFELASAVPPANPTRRSSTPASHRTASLNPDGCRRDDRDVSRDAIPTPRGRRDSFRRPGMQLRITSVPASHSVWSPSGKF